MIQIRKADGRLEVYDRTKIESSLRRSGVDDAMIGILVSSIEKKLYNAMPSDEIYSIICEYLKESKHQSQYTYNLKRALMKLGPSGFPFEKFIAGVLSRYGYKAVTNQIVSGKCVTHEIDVLASKEGMSYMIECKFHNQSGTKSSIRDVLYTYARFQDVSNNNHFNEAWLVTNTKVTQDAIDYAQCMNMRVVGWSYPDDMSLRDMIEKSGLHPITSRSDLSDDQLRQLIERGIVFSKDYTP